MGLPQEVLTTVEVPGPERVVTVEKELVRELVREKIVPVERVV